MASSLRVNAIIPSSGTNVAIGTAGGTITYNANVTGVSTFSSGIVVSVGSTEALRTDSNSNIGIKTTSTSGFNGACDDVVISGSADVGLTFHSTSTTGTGSIAFTDTVGSSTQGAINYFHNGDYMIFQTGASERMRINSSGDFLLGTTSTGAQLEIDTDNSFGGGDVGCGIRLYHTSTSLGSNNALLGLNCATTNASTYRMAQFNSGTTRSGFGDAEFIFYGNGTANADGSWVGGGADYAEYFEWSDGNVNDEDRRGISVVLDGNKIREALVGEDPIGVISGNPSMVGDAAWNKWSGKYLRDDYGSYVLDEDGYRQLNPNFNPDEEYIPRDKRPEWDCVGLMGKLRIRKGQVTGSRWIKMRDVSDDVEEWLVR